MEKKGKASLRDFVRFGELEKVKTLLENGVNVDEKENDTCSSLHIACFSGQLEMVKLLLSFGANVNDRDDSLGILWTPLHRAIVSGNYEIVQILLKNGASMECNELGETPVHTAAKSGQTNSLRTLLEFFPFEIQRQFLIKRDLQGRNPFQLAQLFGHEEAIQYLQQFTST